MKLDLSSKRTKIDKAQATLVGAVAAAVFITVFSLVSARSLLRQRSYQSKVIEKQETARDQLHKNLDAVNALASSYKQFVSSPDNVIAGNPRGSGDRDGDNGKITLDALPSKYDFPALTSSLEKILTDKKFKGNGISGTDDEVAQSTKQASNNPETVEIPFNLSVSGSYQSVQDLINVLQRSIRPINIQTMSLNGGVTDMKLDIKANTYYQPEKTFDTKTQVLKEGTASTKK